MKIRSVEIILHRVDLFGRRRQSRARITPTGFTQWGGPTEQLAASHVLLQDMADAAIKHLLPDDGDVAANDDDDQAREAGAL